MSVRIETCAWGDDRFALLAKRVGFADADHAIGKMARLWQKCTIEMRYVLTEEEVNLVLGPKGSESLVSVRLGVKVKDGIRICGTKGRIEWLKNIRENGKKGGRPKKTRSKPSGFQEPNPTAPSLVPDPAQISDPPPAADDSAGRQVIPIHQHPLFDEGTMKRRAIIRVVMDAHITAFNRLREELGSTARPMQAVGDPAERALIQLLRDMPVLDNAERDCLHVLEIRRLEAEKKHSLRYFGPSVWSPGPFGIARSMTAADVESDGTRKPAQRAGGGRSGGLSALMRAAAADQHRSEADE